MNDALQAGRRHSRLTRSFSDDLQVPGDVLGELPFLGGPAPTHRRSMLCAFSLTLPMEMILESMEMILESMEMISKTY